MSTHGPDPGPAGYPRRGRARGRGRSGIEQPGSGDRDSDSDSGSRYALAPDDPPEPHAGRLPGSPRLDRDAPGGNGAAPADPRYDRPPMPPGWQEVRSAGKHSRDRGQNPGHESGYPGRRRSARPSDSWPARPDAGYDNADLPVPEDQAPATDDEDYRPGQQWPRRSARPGEPTPYQPRGPSGAPRGYPQAPWPESPPLRDPRDAPPLWQQPRPESRPRRPGTPPPSGSDGYVRMSDPAPPAARRSYVFWDEPGDSGYASYGDPLHVGPYPEPPTIALPVIWPVTDTAAGASRAEPAQLVPAAGTAPGAEFATGTFSILRSSSAMAAGTLVSRLTGFLRTLVQVYALGLAAVATAYNNANTLPNVVYNLALGGILTSVIVPLIVNASRRDADRGAAYDQRMFTLITAVLAGITVVATLAAAPLVDLYKGDISGAQLHLMVIFAYFFIPQIFFYGMSSLISAVLNARGSFAAPMWTPVVNNLVVIAVLLMYMTSAGAGAASDPHLSEGKVLLLGVGTTIGIVAQTVALIPALRRVDFRWHPRWDFRRAEVTEIGRMGGWMFCYVAATQAAFLVTTNVANLAAPRTGYTAYTYAWQLFQLPYAVVGLSVITAVLPRMSGHASDGQLSLVRSDFSVGVRLASVIVVPCSLVLAALGPVLGLVFLDHGAAGSAASAEYVGKVFAVFCLGLLPFMMFQLQLRVFYALHDSKTPALIGLGTMSLNIVANLIVLNTLPRPDVVAGLGVSFGLANLLGTVLAWRILSRRLDGLDGRMIGATLARTHAAAIPAALFVIAVGVVAGEGSRTDAAITLVIGGGGGLALYVLFARALGVRELATLGRSILARLGR